MVRDGRRCDESDNIEDRARALQGGSIAGGPGILGLVVLVIGFADGHEPGSLPTPGSLDSGKAPNARGAANPREEQRRNSVAVGPRRH